LKHDTDYPTLSKAEFDDCTVVTLLGTLYLMEKYFGCLKCSYIIVQSE